MTEQAVLVVIAAVVFVGGFVWCWWDSHRDRAVSIGDPLTDEEWEELLHGD